jgi:GAF domain-containing protein
VSDSQPSSHSLPLTDELSAVFARMSGLLLSEETVDTSLGLLSSLADQTVPGSAGAGVSIIDEHGRRSSGATDVRVREADALQYQLDEGPCLAAAATQELVRIDDLAEDRRWPVWAGAAVRLGLRSVMSAPLVAGTVTLGAIKVYGDRPEAFDSDSERRLALFAAQAAILVANVQSSRRAQRLSEGMRQAVNGRDLVNMAKGVLMGRNAVDEDTALGILLARSQQDGSTVIDVARAIVDSAVRRRR